METLSIALPRPLKEFVDEQISSGECGNASEYIRTLIREDQKRKARAALEAKLLQSLDSGDLIEVTPEFWEAQRQKLRKLVQHKGRKARK